MPHRGENFFLFYYYYFLLHRRLWKSSFNSSLNVGGEDAEHAGGGSLFHRHGATELRNFAWDFFPFGVGTTTQCLLAEHS